jgi:protein required for attachment to host cells
LSQLDVEGFGPLLQQWITAQPGVPLGVISQGGTGAHQSELAGQCLDCRNGHHHKAQRQHHDQASSVPHQHQNHAEGMLHLIRQRWNIENEWQRARDAQLGEVAHRCANRIGAPVFSFL